MLKPAEATSLIALELAKIFEEAGLPKGLLSVLVGRGSIIGDAIAQHPLVRKISFTGGTTTGRHLAHIAADKLITTSLELGGKSPTIVLRMQMSNWLLKVWLTVFLARQAKRVLQVLACLFIAVFTISFNAFG